MEVISVFLHPADAAALAGVLHSSATSSARERDTWEPSPRASSVLNRSPTRSDAALPVASTAANRNKLRQVLVRHCWDGICVRAAAEGLATGPTTGASFGMGGG